MLRSMATAGLVLGMATAHAAVFTVTNTSDSGAGSLRAAIAQANASPGADTVNFAVTGTIVLTSGQIVIAEALNIVGPGATALTIDGNANDRIFVLAASSNNCFDPSDYLVSISGLTLANAHRNSDNSGGAIQTAHSLVLDGVVIRDNQARSGAGVSFVLRHPNQSLTITNSQFSNNIAKLLVPTVFTGDFGAGLLISECDTSAPTTPVTVTIASSLFSGNRVQPVDISGSGAAIASFSDADITITDSRIVDNHIDIPNPPVSGRFYRGGAFYGRANSLTIVRSEIADNSADTGGAMHLFNDVPTLQDPASAMAVTLVNSTVSGNAVSQTAGALLAYGNIAVEIDNSTIANNAAPADRTSGITLNTGPTSPASASDAAPPTVTLVSSILANQPSSGGDIAVNAVTIPSFTLNATNSLVTDICATCGVLVAGSGNLIEAGDPLLGPLAFNGGLTRTHAILVGSPVIDAGTNPLNLTTDQRGSGFPRVLGLAADMGAFEAASSAPPPAGEAQPIPTLSEWGMILTTLLLAGAAGFSLRRRD